MFTSCEKDPEIQSTVPYQVVTQDGHCLNALNGRHQGLVLRSRSQYERLVDSFDIANNRFCDESDFQKGLRFKAYNYLVKSACTGGCSARFEPVLQKADPNTLQVTIEKHAYGLCLPNTCTYMVLRIPKRVAFQEVSFRTRSFQYASDTPD